MKGKKRLISIFCLLLAVFVIAPYVPAPGNITTVQAAKKTKKVKNGLKKEKGYYRYYKNGKLQKKKWITVKGKKYYFKKDGNAATGSLKISKKYYIFNEKGQLVTASKSSKKKVVTVKGVKYQANVKGLAAKGWSKDKKYYFGADGKMYTGIHVIVKGYDEKFYCFGKNGKLNESKTKKLQKAAKYKKDMTDLYKLIGKPKKSEYAYGCYGPGKDGYLTYKNFTVITYKENGKEIYMGAEEN